MSDASSTPNYFTSPMAKALGARPEELDAAAGRASLFFEAGEGYVNLGGSIHGGIVTAMLDECIGYLVGAVVRTQRGKIRAMGTVDLHTTFMRPALPGSFRAQSRLIRLAGRLAFAEGSLYDLEGTELARAVATFSFRTEA